MPKAVLWHQKRSANLVMHQNASGKKTTLTEAQGKGANPHIETP